MRHLEFVEILGDLQKAFNNKACVHPPFLPVGGVDLYHVCYQHGLNPLGRKTKGGYFYVYRLHSWTISEPNQEQQITYDLIYHKEVFGPTIKEIFDFVKDCKKIRGNKEAYNEILNKIRNFSDFQDVLELI